MKNFPNPLLAIILLAGLPLWNCDFGGSSSNSGPGNPRDTIKVDTVPKDTGKKDTVKPDTTRHGPCGRLPCADTAKVPGDLDTVAFILKAAALADSGLARGIAALRAKGLDADQGLLWIPTGNDTSDYAYAIGQFGVYKRVSAIGSIQTKKGLVRNRFASALFGQDLNLDDYPVLGLSSRSSSMALALQAEVQGPVLLAGGYVRYTDLQAIRYYGHTLASSVPVWDSSSAVWKSLPIPLSAPADWIKRQTAELEAVKGGAQPREDGAWGRTEILPDAAVLAGKTWEHVRLYCPGVLTLTTGAVFRDCQIVAAQVRIQGDARFEGGAVLAAGRMDITGVPVLDGQFLSGDSLILNVASPLANYPVFYVEGHDVNNRRAGALRVANAQGKGIFIYHGSALYSDGANLILDAGTDLTGFAYTNTYMDIRGRFRGSVIGETLHFMLGGTTYIGHLAYATCALAPVGTRLPFAAVRPGMALVPVP